MLIVVGSYNQDLVWRTPQLPQMNYRLDIANSGELLKRRQDRLQSFGKYREA